MAEPAQSLLGSHLVKDVVDRVTDFFMQDFRVVSSGGRNLAVVWGVEDSKPPFVLRRHVIVTDVKAFPRGGRVATAGDDGRVIIWNSETGETLVEFSGHEIMKKVFEVQVFPDGKRVVSIGDDGATLIWDASSGSILHRFTTACHHRRVRIFPSGDRIVTGATGRPEALGAVVWDAASGAALHALRPRRPHSRAMEVSQDGKTLLLLHDDTISLWRAATGQQERELVRSDRGGHIQTAIFVEGRAQVVACDSHRAFAWDLGSGEFRVLSAGSVSGVVAMPVPDRFVAYNATHAAIWSATLDKPLRTLGRGGKIQRLVVAPEGDLVAACGGTEWPSESQVTTVWDTSSGQVLHMLREGRADLWPTAALPQCSVAVGVGTS